MAASPLVPLPPPGLGKLQPFLLDKYRENSSWREGGRNTETRQYYRRDLEKGLEEIDGLIAGFQYLDTVSPNSPRLSSPDTSLSQEPASQHTVVPVFRMASASECSLEIDDADLQLPSQETDSYATAPSPPSIPEPQPMPSQWADLKSLRAEIEHTHQRFFELTKNSSNQVLCSLRKTFPTAKSVRKMGVIVYKDILNGFQPCQLQHVFAFTSLSYGMSRQLAKRGRLEKHEILSGLDVWSACISDPLQKEAFDSLSGSLWPETKLHSRSESEQERGTMEAFGSSLSQDPLGNAGIDTSQSTLGNKSYEYHPYLDSTQATLLDPLPNISCDAMDLSHLSYEEFAFHEIPELYDLNHQSLATGLNLPQDRINSEGDWGIETSVRESGAAQLEEKKNGQDDALHLRDTGVFIAVLVFINHAKLLLRILSGKGLISRPQMRYDTEKENQRRFYESAQRKFFKPHSRCDACPSRAFVALLSVADVFAQAGYLRSIAEVKYYLITVAGVSWQAQGLCIHPRLLTVTQAFFAPGETFEEFIKWAMCDGPSSAGGADEERKRKRAPSPDDDSDDAPAKKFQ